MIDPAREIEEPVPTSRRPPRRGARTFVRATTGIGLALLMGLSALLLQPFYSSNLGVVDPDRVFRSAQPTSGLSDMIRDHKLASILNLRGGSPRDAYYAHEVRTTREAGVDFYDLSMSATKRPRRRDLLALIDVAAHCKYPLLIHCKSGADRTGLAAAIYRLTVLREPPEKAIEAFTIYHSHIPLFGPQKLHEPIDEYAAWLARNGLSHTPERFRDWVEDDYQAEDSAEEYAPIAPGARHSL